MKAIRYFISLLCAVLCLSFNASAQTTLAAGDIAIVGYNSDDPTNDDFSFILLTAVSSGTAVNFTDFGWCSGAGFTGFQSANPAPCGAGSFGSYSDGAVTWTSTSALPCGTQVRVQCRNSLSASTGTVTGLQPTFNVGTDYMSLAIGGDQIFAFQGSLSSPTLITGISMNGAWDATLAQCTFTSGQSTLPAALSSSTSLEVIPEVDNAVYNCTVTTNSPANLRTAIFNVSNWSVNDATTFTLPIACTFSCNANLAPTFTGGSPQSLTVCQNASATSLNSRLQVSDGNSGQTLTWTITSGPSAGTLGGFNYFTTSTGSNITPTGLTYTPMSGYSGADAFTVQISDGIATATTTINVTVNPLPTVNTVSNQALCNGGSTTAVAFSGALSSTTFNWTNDQTSIGLAASGTGDIASFTATNSGTSPVTATITVTPTKSGCTGTAKTFTITVNPTPTVNTVSNQTLCAGTSTTAVAFSGALSSTTFSWINNQTSIGLAASGTGDIASFTATNSGGTPVTATITVTPSKSGCTGTAKTFTITVDPSPTVNTVSNQALCNGSPTAAVAFSGALSSTTFNWTNDQASIGLAASGSGDIASFTATNSGTAPVVATITVTPTKSGCTGTAKTFTITVNPIPTVNAVSNQALCGGTSTAAVAFSGAVSGTTFNWTNDNTSVGLAASGSGDIASFTAANSGTTSVIATITVTPVRAGCPGTATTFTITVDPSPTVNTVSNQALCNGASTTAVAFSGALSGTTFNWTNDQTSIGLAASGSGDIASFTATNSGTSPVAATITVTPVKGGCTGAAKTFTITVNPIPTVNTVSNQAVCNGSPTTAVTFSGAVSSTTFNWTNDNTSIGLAASGSGDIASFIAANSGTTPVIATITVTPTKAGCPGTAKTFTITVDPSPTINIVSNQALCNGASTTAVAFSGALSSTTFNWTNDQTSIGLAASGSGDIASFTATNSGTSPVVATITVTPVKGGCTGVAKTFTITVNPTPTVNTVSNQTVCNGSPSTAVAFSGAVSSTTFNWTNDNTSIGLAASGSGDIASFTATNNGTTPVTATITVTSTKAGCPGTAKTFTITVDPSPTVNTVSNQAVCNGAATTAVAFSGALSSTTFNWTNDQASIGLAASGSGDIASFMATNSGTSPVVATITVTPVKSGCTGTPGSFAIAVNPTPTVNTVSNQALCNGSSTTAVSFSGAVSGTSFSWTNNNTSIGVAVSGAGDISAFSAVNTGTAPVTATITVTPSANGCPGTATTFTITVNPTPTVNTVSNQAVCNNAATTSVNFGGGVSGTAFGWTNNTTSIGLGTNGTGSIASFTAVNATNAPVTATITVTPSANGCPGSAGTFTITVNPTPSVNAISNQTVCNGAGTAAINFSGSAVSGTTYTWANNTTSIGLAASGTGNIGSFTATNSGTTPVIATIAVTPVANSCPGAAQVFTITVNPTPTINAISNQAVCNNAPTASVTFGGGVSGTTFAWANNTTSIGLGASGSGNIASFTTVNATNAPVIATITATPSADGCPGTAKTFTITVNPTPTVNTISNQIVCNGAPTAAVNFSGSVSGTTFNWANNTTSIGLGTNGTGNISSFAAVNTGTAPVTATIIATPSANGCTGTGGTFTITVNPTPSVNTASNQILCSGASTAAISFTGSAVSGTSYNWTNNTTSIGLAASGSGNIATFAAVNAGTSPVVATITVTPVANGCAGTARTSTITVNPTPSVNTVANQTLCNGASTAVVAFSGAVSGTTYSWVNNNASIGLAAIGAGNISSFSAVNTGTSPVTATITVTPSANGCAGLVKTFTITVNPTPAVNTVSSQAVCNGAATTAVNFSGGVSGTTFSWTNNTTSIGLAANGTGNIASFTAVNTGNAPVTATITITPSANSCTGPVETFTITVNPTPTVNAISNQTRCNSAPTIAINFGGAVSGTSYSWTNNTPSIGLAANGAGNISSFTAVNLTSAPVTATIVVTPVANSCAGVAGSFTITVNPTPTVATVANQAICGGSNTAAVNFVGSVGGTTFAWTNSNTSIGLAASGNGNIPSFTGINSGAVSQVAVVTVGPSANGCTGTAGTFIITVNPIPVLTSTQNAPAICNNTPFNYVPTSATPGTSFAWSRAAVAGISNLAASGFNNIAEQLVNTTPNPIVVTYLFVSTANSCTKTQNVTVTVNPSPKLSSQLSHVTCGDDAFVYTPTSLTSGTTYAWSRANVAGITPATGNGIGGINETLTNNTSSTLTVTYVYMLTANGCTNTENVVLTLNPRPHVPVITIRSPDDLCSQTMFQNFGTANLPPQGATYNWTATNAVVWAQSVTGQQALITFPYPGTSQVILTTTIAGTGCDSSATYTVEVGPQVAQQPEIIYHNGRFVCLQHDMDSYRWGYDNKVTLDSTIIANETNQDYLSPNPNLADNYYWVITTKGGCLQKSYYNTPTTIGTPELKVYELKLYPNPASETITVEFDAANTGISEIAVFDMAGKLLTTLPADNGKVQVDISSFAPGFYSVSCIRDGMKIATAKFIKE